MVPLARLASRDWWRDWRRHCPLLEYQYRCSYRVVDYASPGYVDSVYPTRQGVYDHTRISYQFCDGAFLSFPHENWRNQRCPRFACALFFTQSTRRCRRYRCRRRECQILETLGGASKETETCDQRKHLSRFNIALIHDSICNLFIYGTVSQNYINEIRFATLL